MASDAELEMAANRIMMCCARSTAFGLLFANDKANLDMKRQLSESIGEVIAACQDYLSMYEGGKPDLDMFSTIIGKA